MATTTATAFNDFKSKLLLTDMQKTTVNSRKTVTAGYLQTAFPSSSDLPLQTAKLIGSAGRATIIRPLDDIDVLAVFTNRDGIFETYRRDSQAFLYRVRNALNNYSVRIVGARGQAVRLFYAEPPHVDIAPVFEWSTGGYALPDGGGGWLTTNPDAHAAYVSKRQSELSSNLKPMIRMLKRWNNVHSKYLKSFHLEVVVCQTYETLGTDSRKAAELFFKWAQAHLSVMDPAGTGSDLSSYLTVANRQSVITNLESARVRAVNANAAERNGDHKEAIRLWRIIFGDEFPTYG